MSAILPFIKIDSSSLLANYFTHYQICWIEAEDPFHQAKRQVFALAEKSVRIGWTFCDGFKNVRKRLRFPNRDYLFATKDWPSALEYMNQVYQFADMLGYTRAVLSHGEDIVKVKSLDPEGHPTSLTEEVKIGYIKFQNGSRIIAFSSNPYAMAVYGGDVGLDEFAKHPNARLSGKPLRPASPGPAISPSGPRTTAKTPSSTNSSSKPARPALPSPPLGERIKERWPLTNRPPRNHGPRNTNHRKTEAPEHRYPICPQASTNSLIHHPFPRPVLGTHISA